MGSLWNRSGMVERYADDLRASGAKAFFFQGGTTSRLTVFRDSGESSAHTNPVVADSNGRWPDVFIPYVVSYDVQVKSADDVQLTYSLQIPNPDPVDLSVVIPAEERIQTGMIHGEFVNATKPGYVRLNGRTIGNAASLATERANGLNNLDSDCFNLFNYLYNNLPNTIAAVSGGRGSSATSDFNANKNITLPSMQGASLIGLDDMGNTAAGAFTGLTFNTGGPIAPGSSVGANSVTLSSTQMPAHAHTGTTSTDGLHSHSTVTGTTNTDHYHLQQGQFPSIGSFASGYSLDHTHNYTDRFFSASNSTAAGGNPPGGSPVSTTDTTGGSNSGPLDHIHYTTISGPTAFQSATGFANYQHNHTISNDGNHSHTFTTSTVGGTTPVNNVQLSRLVTWFIKL